MQPVCLNIKGTDQKASYLLIYWAILSSVTHTLVESMESKLSDSIQYNTNHVLHQLLPPEKEIHYNLRQRSHSLTLLSKDNNLIRKNFLHRMLFMDIY